MENTNNHSMKSTTKHVMNNITIAILAAAVAISMTACAAAQPAETTAPTQPITAAAPATVPTEPVETKPAFVPERYEPTLPPEPTVPETEPTEPVEEEDYYEDSYYEDSYYEDSYYEDSTGNSGGDYSPPATEAPAPVETIPPETEPPVTLDYNAAANYGNSYAASTYGWIVDSSVDSYYPACRIEIDYAVNNGGQDCINSWMAGTVDATAWNLGEGLFGVWCECWEDDGCVFFQVCYG